MTLDYNTLGLTLAAVCVLLAAAALRKRQARAAERSQGREDEAGMWI